MIGSLFTPHPLLRRLIADRDGSPLLEFAIVSPVLVLIIFGMLDMAHAQYAKTVLHGAVQKAGRDLTLESAISHHAALDERVRSQIATVMPPGTTITFKKQSFYDFADIAEPEPILGDDPEGRPGYNRCEGSKEERYIDVNDNGRWDKDRGKDGLGGARDAVLYTTTVTYPRLFPLSTMAGLPRNVTLVASTVLRNQPFDEQNVRVNTERNCPP